MDADENGLSEASSTNNDASKVNPWKWTVSELFANLSQPLNGEYISIFAQVSDVCDFVKKLPEASDYVEEFASQEMDGQALMLLKESHLMSVFSMKLGLALKIVDRINALREQSSSQNERS